MEEWQQLTLQGKDAFLSDAYLAAIVHHRQASILAQQQFNAVFSEQPQRALAQVLLSQFNLIDCHREFGDADACVRQFEFCLSTLNSLCGRPCSQTQQVALVTGIS